MIENLPIFISLLFTLTTFVTVCLFYWAVRQSTSEITSKKAMYILCAWMVWLVIQAVLTLFDVYHSDTTSIPPKILILGIFPPIVTIVFLFITPRGREFIDSLPLVHITYLNMVRIPVELVLWCLFINKAIPELMTFEGRNFDIIAGISAPFIAYFGINKGKFNRQIILIWNFICLGLLMNIVVNALLSAPSPFQKFAFDQPNIAILYFPFSWLPSCIVPIVLFGHLVSIRQLLMRKQ